MLKTIQSLTVNTKYAALLADMSAAVPANSAQKNVWWWHELN
ncbi:hypothetical protein [Glaciecola sp.]|jgi:hypothetical protein